MTKNGRRVCLLTNGTAILDKDGNCTGYRGVDSDITERKQAEAALEKALKEKSVLLSELQHRAKNSFAMITSLVTLSANSSMSDETKTVLTDMSSRVNAVSEMYDLLYSTDSITEVRLDEYLSRIASSLPFNTGNISINKTFDSITMPAKTAVSVGIIFTELITNSIKHAFPENRTGTISLSLRITDTNAVIEVKDDGAGIPEGLDISTVNSMGLQLVNILVSQIDGNLVIKNDNGARCIVEFPIVG